MNAPYHVQQTRFSRLAVAFVNAVNIATEVEMYDDILDAIVDYLSAFAQEADEVKDLDGNPPEA